MWSLHKRGGRGSTEVIWSGWLLVFQFEVHRTTSGCKLKLADSALMRKAESSYEVLLRWEFLVYHVGEKSLIERCARGEGRMGKLLHWTTLYAYV